MKTSTFSSRRFLTAMLLIAFVSAARAAGPTAPAPVSGPASFPGNPPQISTPGSITNWQSFAITPSEASRFINQSGAAAVINQTTIRRMGDSAPFNVPPTGVVQDKNSPNTSINQIFITGDLAQIWNRELNPGSAIELVDPVTPGIRVEVKAPSDRAMNFGKIFDPSNKRGIYGGLTNQLDARQATRAITTPDGRIILEK